MSSQVATMQRTTNVKITILGKAAIGKSSLTYRFLNKEALDNHDATIEDKYKAYERIENENVEIEVLDTAGEEDYQNLRDSWISYGEGFVLTFAINDKESFTMLNELYERILTLKGAGCPIIIAGNKCDLTNERVVTYEEGKNLALKWGIPFLETSAKENIKCKDVFMDVAHKIYAKKKRTTTRNANPPCCFIF